MVHPRTSAVQMDNAFYLPGLVMDRMIVEIIRMNEEKYVCYVSYSELYFIMRCSVLV